MPIENRDLKPGTRLVARYKKQGHRAEVVAGEEGKVRYRLEDGREFKSPSAAGTAITGKACNGWAFWSVEGAESPHGGREAPEPATAAVPPEDAPQAQTEPQDGQPEEPAQPVAIKRTPNQRGVPEGQVSFHCSACQGSFLASEGEAPTTCLAGHEAG